MVTKKEATKKRRKYLAKQWNKKHLQSALSHCPLKIRSNFDKYIIPHDLEVKNRYIHGEVGTGKTVLASFLFLSAVQELYYKRGYYPSISAHFVNFPDLFLSLQKSMATNTHHAIYEQYLSCDILVIDDFLRKKVTDWVGDIVYHIINRRYENELLTIITSNCELSEVSDRLQDDRVTRRIEETYEVVKKKHYKKSK